MEFFPNPRLFLSIGPFHITWYALILLTGIIVAYLLSQRTLRKWGYPSSVLENMVIPAVFCALIGARLYYVIFQWGYFSQHPAEIIAIWNGGIAMHGAIIGGALYGLYYCHRHHYSFLRFADAIMPNMLLGQAIGRWGNFMNQEAYGPIVDASFYNGWPAFIKDRMYIDGAYRTPTFLYESVLDLLGFLFITLVFRKYFYRRKGDCAWMYLIWYGCTRLVLEFNRTDALMIGPFRQAQLFSLVLVTAGVLGLLGVWRKLWKKIRPERKPLLLFDLDGTLIDSKPLIFETFRRVFARKMPDHQLTEEELESFFGPTLEQTFERYFNTEEVEQCIDLYQQINKELYSDYVQEIPEVKETLQELKDEGFSMGVVSNKRIAVVERGLEEAGLASYMDVVLGKENLKNVKPSPDGLIQAADILHADYGNIVYIGDTPGDLQAAKNMAAFFVAFSPDSKQLSKLRELKPSASLDHFGQLKILLGEDIEWNDKSIW